MNAFDGFKTSKIYGWGETHPAWLLRLPYLPINLVLLGSYPHVFDYAFYVSRASYPHEVICRSYSKP